MLSIRYVARFKKDLKKYQHQTLALQELNEILKLLMSERKLPEKYRDHLLSGGYSGMRECHVKPQGLFIKNSLQLTGQGDTQGNHRSIPLFCA